MALTVREIQALKVGEWASDSAARGAGVLTFRRSASGEIRCYFRYTTITGKRDIHVIGTYDESGRNGGKTLTEARIEAGELSRLYQSGVRDLRAHFEAEQKAKEAAEEAAQAAQRDAEREVERQQQYTLEALCKAYCDHLEAKGKAQSARQARSIFKCHIFEADAELSATPAQAITAHHIAALVRKVAEKGKDRAAGILRSYLSAAFNTARKAPFDPKLPSSFIAFGVESNPVEPISTIAVNRGDRTLTTAELKAYMAGMTVDLSDTALKLALYAGGQRMAQLLRAKISDYDAETQTLRLWDSKGRRTTAREHLLPLGPKAAAIVDGLIERAKAMEDKAAEDAQRQASYSGLWLFSSYGRDPLNETTPGKRLAEICASMGGESFNLRDVRRTCETVLAGMGISREVRAQLLSHGLSGVQSAHYDRHSYTTEKRNALTAWEARLEQISTGQQADNVVQMRGAA